MSSSSACSAASAGCLKLSMSCNTSARAYIQWQSNDEQAVRASILSYGTGMIQVPFVAVVNTAGIPSSTEWRHCSVRRKWQLSQHCICWLRTESVAAFIVVSAYGTSASLQAPSMLMHTCHSSCNRSLQRFAP